MESDKYLSDLFPASWPQSIPKVVKNSETVSLTKHKNLINANTKDNLIQWSGEYYQNSRNIAWFIDYYEQEIGCLSQLNEDFVQTPTKNKSLISKINIDKFIAEDQSAFTDQSTDRVSFLVQSIPTNIGFVFKEFPVNDTNFKDPINREYFPLIGKKIVFKLSPSVRQKPWVKEDLAPLWKQFFEENTEEEGSALLSQEYIIVHAIQSKQLAGGLLLYLLVLPKQVLLELLHEEGSELFCFLQAKLFFQKAHPMDYMIQYIHAKRPQAMRYTFLFLGLGTNPPSHWTKFMPMSSTVQEKPSNVSPNHDMHYWTGKSNFFTFTISYSDVYLQDKKQTAKNKRWKVNIPQSKWDAMKYTNSKSVDLLFSVVHTLLTKGKQHITPLYQLCNQHTSVTQFQEKVAPVFQWILDSLKDLNQVPADEMASKITDMLLQLHVLSASALLENSIPYRNVHELTPKLEPHQFRWIVSDLITKGQFHEDWLDQEENTLELHALEIFEKHFYEEQEEPNLRQLAYFPDYPELNTLLTQMYHEYATHYVAFKYLTGLYNQTRANFPTMEEMSVLQERCHAFYQEHCKNNVSVFSETLTLAMMEYRSQVTCDLSLEYEYLDTFVGNCVKIKVVDTVV